MKTIADVPAVMLDGKTERLSFEGGPFQSNIDSSKSIVPVNIDSPVEPCHANAKSSATRVTPFSQQEQNCINA